jgi:hypothetical protein
MNHHNRTQDISEEEAKKLVQGPFGNELHKIAYGCLLAFFWSTPQENGSWIIRGNGSAFLLDCGQGPFMVTAAHVYKSFLNQKSNSDRIVAQINDLKFNPVERLIDIGAVKKDLYDSDHVHYEPDIATFRITIEEIRGLKRTPLSGDQERWPPEPPKQGKGIFFAGCSMKERRLIENKNM